MKTRGAQLGAGAPFVSFAATGSKHGRFFPATVAAYAPATVNALLEVIVRPKAAPGFAATSPVGGLRRRTVGFVGTVAQSVSAVAPSAAATTMPVLVASLAGAGTLWSVALAMGLCLLVAGTINEFARRLPATGSLYTYVSHGLGARPGLVAGVALLLGYGFIAMFALCGSAYFLVALLGRVWSGATLPVAALLIVVVAAVAVFLVVGAGVRISTGATLLIEAVSVALVLILVGALLVAAGSTGVPSVDLAVPGIPGLAVGAALAVTGFVGFESATTLGRESARPLVFIPRAVRLAVLASGLLYLLSTYGQLTALRGLSRSAGTGGSLIDDLADSSQLQWVGLLLDLSVAASLLACAIASVTALVRVLFTMALDGVLPPVLARVDARRRTPLVAAAWTVGVVGAVPALLIAVGVGLWSALQILVVVAAASFLVAYLLVAVAAPPFLARVGEPSRRATVLAVLTAVLLGFVTLVYLAVEVVSPTWPGVAIAAALLGGGSVWLVVRHGQRPPGERRPGDSYDVPTSHDVLGG